MRIAILGLGRMGTPMARNLIELGHETSLYDRVPARTKGLDPRARVAATVAEAVQGVQVALTMVTDDATEESLTFGPGGLLESLAPGAIHLCMSSIGVEASRRLAAAHAEAGQGFVAAPVLGTPSAAATRHLWILAAGPDTQVNRCMVLLEALGRGITRVGPKPELAHALKLGANALKVAMAEGLAEVLAFGEKAGCAPADYLRVLNLGLFKSPLVDALGAMIVRRDHDPSDQSIDQAMKDMALLVEAAGEQALPMPMANILLEQLQEAGAAGKGSLDLTALALLRRSQAGLAAPEAKAPKAKAERRKDVAKEGRRHLEPEPPKVEPPKVEPPRPEPPQPEPPRPEPPQPEPPRPEPTEHEPWVLWAPEPEAPVALAKGGESTYSVMGPDGILKLELGKTTHFEEEGDLLWAWSEGARYQTFWHSFPEVELALGDVLFVKVTPRVLLNPSMVQDLKPLFAGRSKVLVTGGLEFLAGREATRRLELLLGL